MAIHIILSLGSVYILGTHVDSQDLLEPSPVRWYMGRLHSFDVSPRAWGLSRVASTPFSVARVHTHVVVVRASQHDCEKLGVRYR